jgi:hypothetical protein
MGTAAPTADFVAIAREVALLDAAERACACLSDAGLDVAVFKGSALAGWCYPPGGRPMQDVDLLIRPRDRRRAVAALLAAGYQRVPRPHSPTGMWLHPTLDWLGPTGALVDVHVGIGAWLRFRPDLDGILDRAVPAPEVGPRARRPAIADLVVLHALDVAKDDGRCKPTADDDLRALLRAGVLDWAAIARRARRAGCAGTLWARMVAVGAALPAEIAALRPGPAKRWLLAHADTRGRLLAGAAQHDRLRDYVAATALYAGRSGVDRLLRTTSR